MRGGGTPDPSPPQIILDSRVWEEALFQFNTFSGSEGKVTVPAIGGVAGICRAWTVRREDSGPNVGLFRLHVVLSYVNQPLLNSDEFRKEFELVIKRDPKTKKPDIVRFSYSSIRVEEHQVWAEGCTPIRSGE